MHTTAVYIPNLYAPWLINLIRSKLFNWGAVDDDAVEIIYNNTPT